MCADQSGAAARGRDIGAIFQEGSAIDEALARAAASAAIRHKQQGIPLVVWRQGRVHLIPPDEINVPGTSDEPLPTAVHGAACAHRKG